MKLDTAVCLSVLLAAVFLGIVGAFLIYVPALTVITASIVILGLGLMFALGLIAGRRRRKLPEFPHHVIPFAH